jgi:signal peptidase II
MAFGIDIGGKLFLTLFSAVASIGIVFYLYKIRYESLIIRMSLAMILGGAIGNLIDRVFYGVLFGEGSLFYGKVVDFFDIDFFDFSIGDFHVTRWPVFNVADACVTIGVLLLLVSHRKFAALDEERLAVPPETVMAAEPPAMQQPSPDTKDETLPRNSS